MIEKRLASPEYKRDLRLPAGLAAVATEIKNDDWALACRQIDVFMAQLIDTAVTPG